MSFEMQAVGFVSTARTHHQNDFWGGTESCITLVPGFDADALAGIGDFSHVEIVFLFHRVDPAATTRGARHPRNNPAWPKYGIFAQRGKDRPNRIGCTICSVVRVEGTRLFVRELDAIDGTPVLDIKPVMTEFLPRSEVRQPAWSKELMESYWLPEK